ncbi:anti-phage dCTP deaminase [Phyllobacterium zundukense]|uniref:anti-phage dCTP deaminase n=1 Tax=Phyllobacterium zundukense TaxID=1867719 RepID=UPI0029056C19|nr:anti-phage dCTP deaminase [Phyllobacterium zundukense]
MRFADDIRKSARNNAALAALAIQKIRQIRSKSDENKDLKPEDKASIPLLGTAYIIRQFKREEEIRLLRSIYGRKFVQISIFLDKEERKKIIMKKIRAFSMKSIGDADCEKQAIDLIDVDNHEKNDEFGQRISDVFHLGDVFVLGREKTEAYRTINRFIESFFGNNGVSPTKMEYGMYAAAGAALRSIDLSRQVGAAIFSPDGEIISAGCNEVPKAFGGSYWCDDLGATHRDFDEGGDANQQRKMEILHDFVERLGKQGYLSDTLTSKGDVYEQVGVLTENPLIKESQLMDIIEYGRMIHAEMLAITDAARLGKAVKNSILFCTTFPCHVCAKHIVASGIRRLVFLEPYPKSYAEKLHSDSISFYSNDADSHVIFEPFIGISPRRYRDIFEKRKRKDSTGKAQEWSDGKKVPRIEDRSPAYVENEVSGTLILKGLRPIKAATSPAS